MSGFTLIELMITVAIVAILAAVAYPSYQAHVARGFRSQGQQFLMDIAQRQEQYMLDQRQYATILGAGAGGLGIAVPLDALGNRIDWARNYQDPIFTVNNGATPPTFTISLRPDAARALAADGALVIDNLQRRWRETDLNNVFGANDCRWEDTRCTPS